MIVENPVAESESRLELSSLPPDDCIEEDRDNNCMGEGARELIWTRSRPS